MYFVKAALAISYSASARGGLERAELGSRSETAWASQRMLAVGNGAKGREEDEKCPRERCFMTEPLAEVWAATHALFRVQTGQEEAWVLVSLVSSSKESCDPRPVRFSL